MSIVNRQSELEDNWSSTMADIKQACDEANRNFDDVTVIAVTKTWPATDVDVLAQLGVHHVGENRDQEAKEKHTQVKAQDLIWHAIGQIQTNKVKSIIAWADVVHSVDRIELVQMFAKHLDGANKTLDIFVQVNLDEQYSGGRGGVQQAEVLDLVELIAKNPCFRLLGVMGVAPLHGDAKQAFADLQSISGLVQQVAPEAKYISAGMSDDYKIALKYGATHLRLGSLILGHRTYSG